MQLLGRVESGLVSLPGKALTRDAMRRLRFVVHAASCLHSMVLHGRMVAVTVVIVVAAVSVAVLASAISRYIYDQCFSNNGFTNILCFFNTRYMSTKTQTRF